RTGTDDDCVSFWSHECLPTCQDGSSRRSGYGRRGAPGHRADALLGRDNRRIDILLAVLGAQEPALELAGVEVDTPLLHLLVPGAVEVVAHVGHGVAVVVQPLHI